MPKTAKELREIAAAARTRQIHEITPLCTWLESADKHLEDEAKKGQLTTALHWPIELRQYHQLIWDTFKIRGIEIDEHRSEGDVMRVTW